MHRITKLREEGLTTMMLISDILRRRLGGHDQDARGTQLGVSGADVHAELPREDQVLCNVLRRVALQANLPKCDAKGILECVSGRAPWPVQIPGDDSDGVYRDSRGARVPGAGTARGNIDPRDSRRAGKCPGARGPRSRTNRGHFCRHPGSVRHNAWRTT
ncbi:hypothetical protein E2562_013620 [Oryza meyeriana var. granulata]|uniref:Uncharacterized protein n=1 Tax=Oryza meyeriana var. granulata TaxID=110450 RepID=A0A6G1C4Z5_9ORYZ|nr:hypothetical protein E2562_013620 [Oryza meyeriana var. granulata]